jgi:hypothetical protein
MDHDMFQEVATTIAMIFFAPYLIAFALAPFVAFGVWAVQRFRRVNTLTTARNL